jgi:20S proteasome subunit beta 7
MWAPPNYSGKVADPEEVMKAFRAARNTKVSPFVEVPAITGPAKPYSSGALLPSKRTTEPIVTGSSILAIKFRDGVMMAADTLGAYGRLAMFESFSRIRSVSPGTIIGGGGDLSDFQQIMKILIEMANKDYCHDDGHYASPHEYWAYLTRLLYQRRGKGDPLWSQLVVAGVSRPEQGGAPFLGFIDLRGTAFEENIIATGYGAYIAIPILRDQWRADLTAAEARQLLTTAMRVLQYRECRTINRIQFATITATESTIEPAIPLDLSWDISEGVSH